MKVCRLFLFLSLLFFLITNTLCQNVIGIPNIINYPKDVYNAGSQNWDIVQDENNFIYFANNEGLLRFDGTYWKLYPLPNKSVVRSIAVAKDHRIYAGGQNEFGYFAPDRNGKLVFTSLKNLLSSPDLSFIDIWDIIPFGEDIFFKARDKIFQYNHSTIQVYHTENEWRFLGLHQNKLVAQDLKKGLLAFTGREFRPFLKENIFDANFLITSLIPFGKDSSLLTTQKGKVYVLAKDVANVFTVINSPFPSNLILSAVPVSTDRIAIGTDLSGCYIINKKGAIIQNLSRKDGLQNNNIVSLFRDRQNNLWLGLDNGIDFIAINNGIEHLYPEMLNEGVGYSSIIYNKELYIGTSNGLFKTSLAPVKDQSLITNTFQFIANSKGSVWSLAVIEGNLLMANHEGAFIIRDGVAYPVNTRCGYWNFLPLSKTTTSSVILFGSYNGIDLFARKNNTFYNMGTLSGIKAAPRSMAADKNNTVWVGTSFSGIYKIQIDSNYKATYKRYRENRAIPGGLKNRIFKIKNQIVAATEKGIYTYSESKDAFEESPYYKTFFNDKDIRLLKEDSEGNIWFVEGKSLGLLDNSQKKTKIIYFPELDSKMVSGNNLEFVYPYNRQNIFIGSEKGFYHINLEGYEKNNFLPQVKIVSVKSQGFSDSLLFDGYYSNVVQASTLSDSAIPKVNSSLNSFRFDYSSPSYAYQPSIQYSYRLEGFDKQWSIWSKSTQKEYTNLPPGMFTFKVRAKTNLRDQFTTDAYTFTILPPFYRTWWAYLIYIIVVVCAIYFLIKKQKKQLLNQQKKYEEEQKKLEYLHKLELENSEKEIVALKNEKLKAEIEGKNSELASIAMHLVHKGEILSKIKEELVRLNKTSDTEGISVEFKKLIRALKEEDKLDEDWNQFATHFDNVNSDFLKNIKEAYPNLTPNEVKLCTYLQMNLSSKEIAQLLNISVRGVEISRYRLRKKLQIPTEINMYEFLLDFTSTKSKQKTNS